MSLFDTQGVSSKESWLLAVTLSGNAATALMTPDSTDDTDKNIREICEIGVDFFSLDVVLDNRFRFPC